MCWQHFKWSNCKIRLSSKYAQRPRSEFWKQLFQEFCKILEIKKTRTTPRNSRSNGLVERFNRTLISMIKSYIKGKQTDWDNNWGCLVLAYRSTCAPKTHCWNQCPFPMFPYATLNQSRRKRSPNTPSGISHTRTKVEDHLTSSKEKNQYQSLILRNGKMQPQSRIV